MRHTRAAVSSIGITRSPLRGHPAILAVLAPTAAAIGLGQACAGGGEVPPTSGGTGGAGDAGKGGEGGHIDFTVDAAPDACVKACSDDLHAVLDCTGAVIEQCSDGQGCNLGTGTCTDPCEAATANRQSIGCEYYATNMDQFHDGMCFAAFVANTWDVPAHIQVDFAGSPIAAADFAYFPSGAGPGLTYAPYDPAAGIPPGEVVILFLAGKPAMPGDPPNAVPCPVPSAVPAGSMLLNQTGVGHSFRITSDAPVVAYQINPYGGSGNAQTTGASLLLPTSAWDTNYLAVTAFSYQLYSPSLNIVAAHDDTKVTILPKKPIAGGGALEAGPAGEPYVFSLQRGEQAQLTQKDDLLGSVIQSDKPVGLMAGQPCMYVPAGAVTYCDHGEQMIPPVKALGDEHVGVMFRPRVDGDRAIWRVVGAVDGTVLTWSKSVGGPTKLDSGASAMFYTDEPFVVKSQDADHPFMLFAYMSSASWVSDAGVGDPDFVIGVPPRQYLSRYVFFTDPTYPETNLVVVRTKRDGAFADVTLDCRGALDGWQPVGDYEWTRVDLSRHDFKGVGSCSTGKHEMHSDAPFGLWVWGWGSNETAVSTANVSYGYPGGMRVQLINKVVLPVAK